MDEWDHERKDGVGGKFHHTKGRKEEERPPEIANVKTVVRHEGNLKRWS